MDAQTRRSLNAQRLKLAHPSLAAKVLSLIADLESQGYQPLVDGDIWRSPATQLAKYRARFSQVTFGYHCAVIFEGGKEVACALAADVVDCRYLWNISGDHPYWSALGRAAKKQGLEWGGSWKFKDWAHVQLLPNSRLAEVKAYYKSGGKSGYMPPFLKEEEEMQATKKVKLNGKATKHKGAFDPTQQTNLLPAALLKELVPDIVITADDDSVEITLPKKK